MNFCSNCGAPLSLRIPAGDNLPRHVCDACRTIHYQNPKLVIGAIPEWQDAILLCRRAIEPCHGLWTLPAGFMENGETTPQAALRETREEALAEVDIGEPFALFNVPHISQVHLFFRARLLRPDFGAGVESLEVRLFREDDIAWEDVAFASVRETLRHFFADRRRGRFAFHSGDIHPDPAREALYRAANPPDFIP